MLNGNSASSLNGSDTFAAGGVLGADPGEMRPWSPLRVVW